ncbi:hypothetical protein [Actinoplanes nipponensis]|nr:hypothetical protein [Actinoplanes nipponensis]
MHNLGFALEGAWKVLLAGLLLGAASRSGSARWPTARAATPRCTSRA